MEFKKYKNIVIIVFISLGLIFLFIMIKTLYLDLKEKINYNKLENGIEVEFNGFTINKYKNNKYEIIYNYDSSYYSCLIENNEIKQVFIMNESNSTIELFYERIADIFLIYEMNENVGHSVVSTKFVLNDNYSFLNLFNNMISIIDFNSLFYDLPATFSFNMVNFFNQYKLNENNGYDLVKCNGIINFNAILKNENFN